MPSSTIKPVYDAYFGATLSIPNDSAPHQLLALMRAANPTAPPRAKYFTIQNHPITSTANAYIGESAFDNQGVANPTKLTLSNCAIVLLPADTETFGGFWDEYNNLARYWAINDGSGTGVLNINVQANRG